MSNVISIKGLPDNMIRRIVTKEITETELAYANIGTILLIPVEARRTLVVFDVKGEWNYISDKPVPTLLACLAAGE